MQGTVTGPMDSKMSKSHSLQDSQSSEPTYKYIFQKQYVINGTQRNVQTVEVGKSGSQTFLYSVTVEHLLLDP